MNKTKPCKMRSGAIDLMISTLCLATWFRMQCSSCRFQLVKRSQPMGLDFISQFFRFKSKYVCLFIPKLALTYLDPRNACKNFSRVFPLWSRALWCAAWPPAESWSLADHVSPRATAQGLSICLGWANPIVLDVRLHSQAGPFCFYMHICVVDCRIAYRCDMQIYWPHIFIMIYCT